MKTSLLTTGLNGLVGSKFADDFGEEYDFDRMDISDPHNPVDITNFSQVLEKFKSSEAKFVLHLAAFTNVAAAWEQNKDKGGSAYQVNVEGTKNIIKACQETKKHLIHISTANIFDGKKEGLYTEDDKPNPIEWYGQTKAWAEEAVMDSEIDWTILRIDYPFRSDEFHKEDVVRRIMAGIRKDNLYPQFTNHYFGLTFIDDFAKVIDWVIRTDARGLFNASSGEKWSDYDFASAVNKILKLGGKIKKGDLAEYRKTLDRSRPYQKNTALDCSKLKNALDFELLSIEEAIGLIEK